MFEKHITSLDAVCNFDFEKTSVYLGIALVGSGIYGKSQRVRKKKKTNANCAARCQTTCISSLSFACEVWRVLLKA